MAALGHGNRAGLAREPAPAQGNRQGQPYEAVDSRTPTLNLTIVVVLEIDFAFEPRDVGLGDFSGTGNLRLGLLTRLA